MLISIRSKPKKICNHCEKGRHWGDPKRETYKGGFRTKGVTPEYPKKQLKPLVENGSDCDIWDLSTKAPASV